MILVGGINEGIGLGVSRLGSWEYWFIERGLFVIACGMLVSRVIIFRFFVAVRILKVV